MIIIRLVGQRLRRHWKVQRDRCTTAIQEIELDILTTMETSTTTTISTVNTYIDINDPEITFCKHYDDCMELDYSKYILLKIFL